ncbi:MAG: hypothetical protein COB17_00835 [Sulfurimonas sp.]|nr:MAG: hypothetical protein COB17_00835 [Sulfurimonas sp.]
MVLNNILIWSISTLNRWYLRRIEKYNLEIPNNKDNYEALIPNTQDKKKTSYANPFTVALKTPNVNNIAITGSYGSGKSSFLRKFEKENVGWHYLPISLATFTDSKEDEINHTDEDINDEETSKKSANLHQDIERSILQQFFYREKDKTIPFSRFKKIKKVSKIDILLLSISIPYLYLYIFRPKIVHNLLPEIFIKFTQDYNYIFLGLTIMLFLAGFYRLLYFLGSFQISKFDIKKNSITVAQQDKASILNEHIDEILYFFEATNYDVVIFEDIDRFNNTEIFVKLRELNNLINNSKEVNRRVVFVYAIRDDMFVDKERTKFFDFIVPVIPYINPSNSEQKLIDKFKQEVNNKSLNEHFLTQISWYIDDMRLLINIYNEYMIYKNNLNSDKLDHNKLLALIVCKNFYPLDFAKLHIRDGLIYKLFANKPKYIKEQIEQYNDEKARLLQQIESIENESIQSIEELHQVYIGKFIELTGNTYFKYDRYDQEFKISNLSSDDFFEKFGTNQSIYCYQKYGTNEWEAKTINLNDIQDNKSFKQRKELIEDKLSKKADELKKEIESIDKNINKLKHSSLKELFKIASESIITDDYEDKDLLIFLVRNGYIDEYYEHYISYFHEGGITQDDREFLLSIQNHKPLSFTALLGNISKLLDKLDEKDFESEYILNNQLTNHLLKSTNTKKKEIYFNHVFNGSNKSIEFIFQYIEYANDEAKELFIEQLTWDGLWSYIYKELSTKEQNIYFKLLFDTLKVDKLIKLDMSSYLSEQTVLPKYTDEDNEKCKELIDRLEIEFKYIQNPSDNPPLFSHIYINGHYILNPKMIEIIVREKGNVKNSTIDELKYQNLTIIRESEAEKLIEIIDKNIDTYYEGVFNELDENKQESEDTLLYLLNHNELDVGYKETIIERTETKVSDITSVAEKELWKILLIENKIEVNWSNLLSYYTELEEQEINYSLIEYFNIEENYKQLSESKINNEKAFDKDEILQPFNTKLILSSSLSDEAYSYLIKSIWFIDYSDLNIKDLSVKKIESILSTSILSFTQENINSLKEDFSPKHITLIEKNKDDFLEKVGDFELESDDVLKIVNSSKFIIEEKFQIIENINLSLFDESKDLKQKVSKLYIDNNKNIESIDLFDKLFYGENQYALELLISRIEYFEDCDTIKQYLEAFENQQYKELLDKNASKLYLDDTDLNKMLLTKLESKDCISSWKENEKTLGKNNLKVERKRV